VKLDKKETNTKRKEFYFAFEYVLGTSRRLSLFGFLRCRNGIEAARNRKHISAKAFE
jgi:hypothetical protein